MDIGGVVQGIIGSLFQSAVNHIVQPFLDLLQVVALSPDSIAKMTWITDLASNMKAVGMAILILIVMWQSFKSTFGLSGFSGLEVDEPAAIAFKAFIGVFLVYYMPDVLNICISIGSDFITIINSSFSQHTVDAQLSKVFLRLLQFNLIYILLLLYLLYKYVVLFFKMFKRLVMCGLLIVFSPLAAACMVSKPTAGFFQGFIKLFAGNIAIQMLQAGTVVAMMISLENIVTDQDVSTFEGVINIMITISVIQVADHLEDIIRDISMTVGIGRDMQGVMGKIQSASMMGYYASKIFK